MEALALGIDVGTSTTKGVVADAEGKVLWTATASYEFTQPRPGWAEQDPADWWKAVCKVVRTLLGEHPGLEKHIVGIGVSGQGVAAVLLDCAGQALRPAILWLDARCAPQAEALEKRLGKQIAAVSGKRPAAYNVAPKLLWVSENEPEVWARAWKVMTTTAYITYRLTGCPVMNHSDAGILLAYDLAGRSWSWKLQEAMELPPKIYCELADCDEVIGSVTPDAAEATGLRVGTPVVAGGEDTSSAGLAAGVLSPQDALLSLGTAATVYVPAVEPHLDARLLAFPHVIRGLTLVGGSMVAGGSAMNWVANLLDADHSEERWLAVSSVSFRRTPAHQRWLCAGCFSGLEPLDPPQAAGTGGHGRHGFRHPSQSLSCTGDRGRSEAPRRCGHAHTESALVSDYL